ncbi:hypothetical protein LWI29_020317 [Acer saccharum]|uniref:Integrase catalytic domain-containing protein n=1 Tax=Acer saccharum TaxID=4024 RepID=A0AA39TFX5_ACESA|nr:hypothetical protein LWI29_020317 [Acer saccharum]
MSTKFEVEKFTGSNDFGLWKMKMKAVLVKEGLVAALEGVMRHKIVRKTPQQNGLAERMNKTILESVRSMLSCANLSVKLWAEAAHTVVYLINRTPSSTKFKKPLEKWTNHPVDYGNSKIFGCTSYIHTKEGGKLDPRVLKCIFLGHPDGVKGYKFWNPTTRKCIISRDVVFKEDELVGV